MLLKYKKILLLLVVLGLAFAAQAQTLRDISGFVCTRGTSVRVAQVTVTNVRTKAVITTDDQGSFTVKAAMGDTLEFVKYDYTTVKLPVVALTDLVIFLQKVTMLNTVTVKGETKQQELNSIMKDYNRKGVYANGKPSAVSAIVSPINGLYSLFGKDPKNARRFAEYAKGETEAAQDSRKYNKALVKKITNIPDADLQRFMDAYKPLHQDLLKWSDYDVITYIKQSYESFKKYGAEALPSLNAPPQ